jgi:sugar phosphate isomerase/epimerase
MSGPKPWPIGISTGIYYNRPILTTLPRIAASGVRLLEICSFPAHFDYHDSALAQQVRQEIEARGLVVHSLHAPFSPQIDITLLDDDARRQAVVEVKRAAEALATLGGRVLVIHPGSEIGQDAHRMMERLHRSADSLNELHSHCAALGLTLAVEDMLPHLLAGRTADLLWLLEQLPNDHVGFCLDTGHAYLARELIQRIDLFGPWLLLLHASDTHGSYDDHLPPGEGAINWQDVVHALRRVGFNGAMILEVAGREDEEGLWRSVQRSVEYLRDLTGRTTPSR